MKKNMLYGLIMLLVAAVAAIFIISSSRNSGDTPAISLPSPITEGDGTQGDTGKELVQVDAETVQTVLAGTINRATTYSRTLELTTFWADKSSTALLEQWQKGENMRLTYTLPNGTVKNLLAADGLLSVWYEDGSKPVTTSLGENWPAQADRFAGLITYEELLRLPVENIMDASYETLQGQPCIYAEYSVDEHYVNQVYISISTGLMIFAQIREDGTLIYEMEQAAVELSTPSDDIFLLPSTKTA